jgi:transcriptional regulator with XRE-family HTH domain
MTLGEKLSKLRKEHNYTQEQLADILGVSRQSISKWESDIAYPETDKLIKMGRLFDCSMDYLLKEDCTDPTGRMAEKQSTSRREIKEALCKERKSERLVWGMPLYHVGKHARGFFAVGVRARGVIAVGLMARGIVSLGLFSLGFFSFGLLSIGLAAFGVVSLGLLSAGSVALGLFAAGAISVGIVAIGALSVGQFSIGALAIGKYLAIGDHARAMIAFGLSEAVGSVYQHLGPFGDSDIPMIVGLLQTHVPSYLSWLSSWMLLFLP